MGSLMYGGAAASSSGASKAPQADLGLDSSGEKSFISFFKSMPEKPSATVRIFDRGDFYSAHGDDALFVATSVFKTSSVIKYLGGGSNALPSVTMTPSTAKTFLRDALTARQMRIEIWKGGGKRSNGWTLGTQASPGNLQGVEDLLFVHTDIASSPIVMAIKLRSIDGVPHIGAAFADATNRTLGVSEFADNDLFSNVESLLIQLGVKECLLAAEKNDPDADRLWRVVDRCGVIITERKKGEFTGANIEQDIDRLLLRDEGAPATLPELNLKQAMGAMNSLISYLGLLHDDTNFGQFRITTHDLSQFLRLDASAVRALSLFSEPGQGGGAGNRQLSVHGLLNKCKTAQGTRLLSQWLKQPLVNLHEIQKRHDLVEVFVDDAMTRQALQNDYLKLMPDLHRLSKKFQKGVATLEDVVRVYQAVLRLADLTQAIADTECSTPALRQNLDEVFVEPLREHDENLAKLVEMVEATLDLAELEHHNFVIKPDFDEKLRRIRDELDAVRDQLDEEHRSAGKELKLELDKKLHLENHSSYGWCMRVTRSEASALKGKRGYSEITTIKGGVYFTTAKIKDLDAEFQSLSSQYDTQQSGLAKNVVEIAASYCLPLEQLNVKLATLDVIVSFAHVSANAPEPYVRPVLHERSKAVGSSTGSAAAPLKAMQARHPVLEVQEDVSFIANDVEMVPDSSEFLVITGPNMGGKSTFIRQVGILALLAQSGCFIPAAAGAELPIFDCILARVGAGDSQLKGVSTFMQEMLELAQILRTATPDSLVLIDELGRGTSTYDGFGIAYAASEWMATKVRCKTLFASHFAEITSLADQLAHVKNLHVAAHVSSKTGQGAGKQDRDITLLYKVKEGISDRSYGIHVAELAGFPPSVIRLAKRKAEELEDYASDDEDEGEHGAALDMPQPAIDKGTALVEEFLAEWAKRSAKRPKSGAEGEGDAEGELEELRKVTEEYRERIEKDPWAQRVLASF
ncbi:putative DNA mismatch repair protein MSH2 [Jaminaea rosea]|uniref:Putative DNA mismatch repair protein MSH2 n=1 Tax=Jaminaea rosea TaxID=1569628 RepID=A0A316UZ86_9BASI|nr:putative DNA mismatch repair protein MSH2 [Jaminaea rosea]PWN30108.1 putative DNA mismatch repair protein MSH2 [Jaminaea rosea]